MSVPDVHIGDFWSYRRVDYANKKPLEPVEVRVTSVEGRAIVAESNRAGLHRDSKWTPEWNAVALDTGWVFNTESGLLKFPLEIGQTHEVAYEAEHRAYGLRVRFRGKSAVAGWEEVVVPAGKFQALKIEISGRYDRFRKGGTPGPGNERFDRRETSPVQETIWYVPAVRRWVKRVYIDVDITHAEELVSFNVQ